MDWGGTIELRPARPDDEPLLRALLASNLAAELAHLDPAQHETFLELQWTARSRDYRSRYPGPEGLQDRIVLADGSPVGRLLTGRDADGLVIVDVALLPDYRGKGIGSTLLRALLAEADTEMTVVHLFVTQTNPAIRLYRRLGFSEVSQIVPYVLMEWQPSHAPHKMR